MHCVWRSPESCLSATKRVYREVEEAINCPQKPSTNFLRNDALTLDNYMMTPIEKANDKCNLNSYIDSFDNSFI